MGINKCIDLLKEGQPFYATHAPELNYDAGVELAQTWADMILIDFEHRHFDVGGLDPIHERTCMRAARPQAVTSHQPLSRRSRITRSPSKKSATTHGRCDTRSPQAYTASFTLMRATQKQ